MKITTVILCFSLFIIGFLAGEKITFKAFEAVHDEMWQQRQMEYESALRTVIRRAACESSLRHNAVGDGGKSRGILQYQRATFDYHAERLGRKDLATDWLAPENQILLGLYAELAGYGKDWTCKGE